MTPMGPMTRMPSAVTMAVTMVATMVAMMLPSVAPAIWRHHRRQRALQLPRSGRRTMVYAVGYASIWIAISLALFAASIELSQTKMFAAVGPFGRWIAAAVTVCAGALQRSRWKADRLDRCRVANVGGCMASTNMVAAWRAGVRLGVDCAQSCAAPMAVLIVGGLTDVRMMIVITAAITAERVAGGGARLARLTGAVAIVAGVVMGGRMVGW